MHIREAAVLHVTAPESMVAAVIRDAHPGVRVTSATHGLRLDVVPAIDEEAEWYVLAEKEGRTEVVHGATYLMQSIKDEVAARLDRGRLLERLEGELGQIKRVAEAMHAERLRL